MGLFDFFKGSSQPQAPQPVVESNRIDLNNSLYRQGACDRVGDGLLHLSWAREAVQVRNMDYARSEYLKAVESWKQANEVEEGRWQREHELVTQEYAAFVESDPVYRQVIAALLPIIEEKPGILQTELYNERPDIPRENISYVLYFAASKGTIERTKKGRTYEVRVKA